MTSPPISVPDPSWTENNRRMWDARVGHHVRSEWYDLDGFLNGRLALDDIERAGVGDVHGRSLLHLQCHFGLGTLSWARLGAEAVGVDFSPAAITQARELAHTLTIPARFVRADVTTMRLERLFDVVFTSWGVLMWLPDITAWAQTVATHLRPGGRFFVAEGHPHLFLWDDTPGHGGYRPRNPYFAHHQPVIDSEAGSYVDADIQLGLPQYRWNHPLSEVVTALANAGLRITALREYPRIPWRPLPWMEPASSPGWWRIEGDPLPLSFSITATKEAP
ncbi:class I SAM-dependent methyltransferase [Nocardiopsis dassonvillei]